MVPLNWVYGTVTEGSTLFGLEYRLIGFGDFGYHVFTGGKGHVDRLSLVASAEQIRETLKLDATIYYALEKKTRCYY